MCFIADLINESLGWSLLARYDSLKSFITLQVVLYIQVDVSRGKILNVKLPFRLPECVDEVIPGTARCTYLEMRG